MNNLLTYWKSVCAVKVLESEFLDGSLVPDVDGLNAETVRQAVIEDAINYVSNSQEDECFAVRQNTDGSLSLVYIAEGHMYLRNDIRLLPEQ